MRRIWVGTLVMVVLAGGLRAQGQEAALDVAKDLYASAAYQEALETLAHIAAATPDVQRTVDEYRVSCLFALGRTTEAETIAEQFITREPLAQLVDAAPRIDALFQDVRKRVMPGLIRGEYKAAKASLDERDPLGARPHLLAANLLLNQAMTLGVGDEALGDLQVLVAGFLDLVDATLARQVSPSAGASVSAARQGAAQSAARSPVDSGDVAAPLPVSIPAAAIKEVYGPEDAGVLSPSVITQDVPQMPSNIAAFIRPLPAKALIEFVINESGQAEEVEVKQGLHPSYDALVINASRRWRYTPAMRDGVPVKFRQTIIITLK